MKTVKITTGMLPEHLVRQTPGRGGTWGGYRFVVNQPVESCDYWVIVDDVIAAESARCPPENVFLLTQEPSSVRDYSARFLDQFARVLTCQHALPHRAKTIVPPYVPWQIGLNGPDGRALRRPELDLDLLSATDHHDTKSAVVSVICSDKAFTAGHRRRIDFVDRLRARFKDRIHCYGRGRWPLADKVGALAAYRYHVALENGVWPDYWTEKIGDAYLLGAFPIYHGCPNLAEFFDPRSFAAIDLDEPDRALETIERLIESDTFERSRDALRDAKQRMLGEHNVFAALARVFDRSPVAGAARTVVLAPDRSLASRLRRRTVWMFRRSSERAFRAWRRIRGRA